jgi:periplasmic divalent cation tolerance protein
MAKDVLVVLVTCPPDKAQAIADALVGARVAACVNVVTGVQSVYRWKGEVHRDGEALLIAKTTRDRFEALKQTVLKLHPYDLPEIVALAADAVHAPYGDWVVESTR